MTARAARKRDRTPAANHGGRRTSEPRRRPRRLPPWEVPTTDAEPDVQLRQESTWGDESPNP